MRTRFKTAVLTLLAIPWLAGVTLFAAEELPRLADAKPTNGVFFTYTGYMTTVLELKEGRFRYWFESDARASVEPDYPLSGVYSVTNNTIVLKHEQVFQKQWTFRTVNGLVTLWRPDAMQFKPDTKFNLKQLSSYGAGSILTPSDKPPENLWKHRGPPKL
jgi:hypothetical protein